MDKKQILLVDDFRIANEILSQTLNDPSFEITCVQNPLTAMKFIEINQVDLVITDYQMPQMNGIELMQMIRGNVQYSKIPVIILSGEKKAEIKEADQKLNVTAWIEKPITADKAAKLKDFIKMLTK